MKTNHSFLEGASFPEELIEAAHAHGLRELALTDRDGVYGLARGHVRARELGLRAIPGTQVHLRGPDGAGPVVLLGADAEGYAFLCGAVSRGQARAERKGTAKVELADLDRAPQGLLALCPEPALLAPLAERFPGRLWGAVGRHLRETDGGREEALRWSARRVGARLVAAPEVLYHDPARRPVADVLACIRHGATLAAAGHVIRANAEHALPSPASVSARYGDAPELVQETLRVAERCTFDLSQIRYRYPSERLPEGATPTAWLRELTLAGARERYRGPPPGDVVAQVERELALIEELDYGGYFLTMHEIVRFCREAGILCQGRGSAANSAVCYCLGITAVDPVRMDLLFERFLSRERAEPPDIDLDIEHERREDVIQHVYGRYGRRHAAMVANVIRYRPRSAIRDVGKVLGVPRTDLDAAARLLRHRDDLLDEALLREAGLEPGSPVTRQLLALTQAVLDFPRHLSIHPGGFLLGHVPVDTLVPIEPATMEGRTVVQWDKYDVEALGLFKVDLLGLGALTCVHRCLDLLREHEGLELDMASVPPEDPATYAMVSSGDTVGVFQIESRAQMAMLPRLRPRTFYDLVIEVAIVRPGPIQGDMVHPYLRRRRGEEPVEYPHPSLERVLARTLGVPIFQEQVMKLAVLAGGYTPGEADQLRRDMAAWRRSGRIEGHHDRLVGRMVETGIPEDFAERVFSQIRGFGEYGFPESHAASFALLAYVTAWLKRHHPAAFTCALLNAQPMGFYAPSTLVEDAKRHGVEVRPVDVSASAWECTLEGEPRAIRMGLRSVKGLGERERARLALAPPPYAGLDDLARRSRLSTAALTALAEAGALEGLVGPRRDAVWAVRGLARYARDALPLTAPASRVALPELTPIERIAWDYAATGSSTHGHPMGAFRDDLRARGAPDAATLSRLPDGRALEYVGLVITRQRPGTASGVTFFTLEDETGLVNVVVWRDVFERHAALAKTAALLGVSGRLQVAEDVTHLVAERLWDPGLAVAGAPRSRDFH